MAKKMGRGLSQLLANIDDSNIHVVLEDGDKISNVDIDKVIPNPEQPRKTFNPSSITELADSILVHGIIQPLIVSEHKNNYIIVAGERRYRAAKEAGLTVLPVIIRKFEKQQTREISLIENLQREDLNAIEEAEALRDLTVLYNLTQEELSKRVGKARSSIANTLRLLALPEYVKDMLKSDVLSQGHARCLLALPTEREQVEFAKKVVSEKMSVRELEEKVKLYLHPELKQRALEQITRKKLTLEMRSLVDDMKRAFGTQVKALGNENKGRICIDYFNREDLERIYEVIQTITSQKSKLD